MKKIFALVIAMMTFCAGSALAAKKVIAVMDVTTMVNTPIAKVAKEDMYQSLVSTLVQDGKFIVVERQQLGTVLRELNLHESGLIEPSTVIEMGHMTGSQYTFIGNIVSAEVIPFTNYLYHAIKAKIKLNYKIIDNRTGRLIKSEVLVGSASTNDVRGGSRQARVLVSKAVADVCEKVMKRISTLNPLDIAIVQIDGEDVYINIGDTDGVKKGDIIFAYQLGKELIDPKSGDVLGNTEKQIGKMKVKAVYEKYSICEIKDGKKKITVDCALRKAKK